MRYRRNLISFGILAILVGLGFLALGTGRAKAQGPCTITIEKVAIPADDTLFDFSITGGVTDSFTLSDPGDPIFIFGIDIEQTVTVTEELPPGWVLGGIQCTEGVINCGMDGFEPCLTATVNGNAVTFECLDNDTASCTFTNIRESRNIPTLSEWGLIAMAGVLGIAGFIVAMRRRKVTA